MLQSVPYPSPNYGDRRGGLTPGLVVLHFTAMPDTGAALERLCDPMHEVSAHYLIAREGTLYQLVEEEKRAWHAGAGEWGGAGDVNSRSVGIELDNCGGSPFSAHQMDVLEQLLPRIMKRWNIPPKGVIGHSDMAPARKSDPGRRFDWLRLARHGLSVWPAPEGQPRPDPDRFMAKAQGFGYAADFGLDAVLDAFRQRFRPQATGPLSSQDVAAIADLAARFPVDRDGSRP